MATLAQNIQRAINDFNTIENAIVQKGVSVPDGTPTSEYGEKILSIKSGVDTSGDTVVPSALREGYTAHNAAGQEITGTIPNYDGSITEGAVPGAEAKYEEGVADGKQAEYDAFWDAYQQNGERLHYGRAFAGTGWTPELFQPKYSMKPTSTASMFEASDNLTKLNLEQFLEEKGITLDTSECTSMGSMFMYSCPYRVPTISTIANNSVPNIFQYSTVREVSCLVLRNDGSQKFVLTFNNAASLRVLSIEGTIGQNGFNVSWSPLSKASIISVINALSDTTTGLTVTVRLSAVKTAFETSEGAADGNTSEEWLNLVATKSNWTINLIDS